MMQLTALLFPVAGLLLSILLVIVVVYATLFRAVHSLLQKVGCLACQPAKTVPTDDITVVKSVKVHGLQVVAGPTTILVPDAKMHQHQQEVIQLFETYGKINPNVYTAFSNSEMEVFLAPGIGCLLYTMARHWCRTVICATGDPLCAAKDTQLMLQLFRQAFPGAIFIDLSKAVAQMLADEGGVVTNDLGNETYVDVQKFNFEFNKKTKHIRRRAEVAAKAGLVVEELTAASSEQMREEVAQMAAEWQAGKVCTDDIKVFSRALPFEHLGKERGVRVFVARTLNPGEAPPAQGALANALLAKKAAAAAATQDVTESAAADSAPLSRKQRKLRERIQRAKALRAASASDITTAVAAAELPLKPDQQQQPDAMIQITETSDVSIKIADQQEQLKPWTGVKPAAATESAPVIIEIPAIAVYRAQSALSPGSSSNSSSTTTLTLPSTASSGNLSSRQSSAFTADLQLPKGVSGFSNYNASAGPRIHACVVLDPIYDHGEVIGYTAERSFLHPRGVKGAVKLVQREALALLKAEGRQVLNLGLAVGYEVKSGAHHGFKDCAWLTRTFRLCYEYGNDLYAFKNLAAAKASYGGGYNPDIDCYKFSAAVELRRKFGVLPASWSWPLGDGVFSTCVMFRHFGVLGDPWELFAFWRFMGPGKPRHNDAECE